MSKKSQIVKIETRYAPFIAAIGGWTPESTSMTFHEVIASALFISATMGMANEFVAGVKTDCGLGPYFFEGWALGNSWYKESQAAIVEVVRKHLSACHQRVTGEIAADVEQIRKDWSIDGWGG